MDCKSDQTDQSEPDHLLACVVMIGTWKGPQPVQQEILNHRSCKSARPGYQDRYAGLLDQEDGNCEIGRCPQAADHGVFAKLPQ